MKNEAMRTPGTARTLTRGPSATRLSCPDRSCSGDGGALPSGYAVAMRGQAPTMRHTACCNVCARTFVVPLVEQA